MCNFVQMSNHNHQLNIPAFPGALSKVYGETKKGITEALKALGGIEQLNLWEDRSVAAVVPTLEDVVARHVYMFCNPAKANLVDSIDHYPGLSSWKAFKHCEASVHAKVSFKVRAYHKEAIPRLPESNVLSEEEDQRLVEELRASGKYFDETFTIQPFAWLALFGITERRDIERVRRRIISTVYKQEAKLRKKRTCDVIGCENLKRQAYFTPHTPSRKQRTVFVFCKDKQLRLEIIALVKAIEAECDECYERAKRGLPAEWPDGVFIPWLPPPRFGTGPP